jgi:CBS-domain-containing membrane protein
VVVLGFTVVDASTAFRAASLYQVTVPVVHVADSVLFSPWQIVAGNAEALVGAAGVGLTVTVVLKEGLLQLVMLTTQAA